MSPRDIDEMEYGEIDAQFDYEKKNPPTHILLQGFFKLSGEDDTSSSTPRDTEEQMKELMKMFPQG